MTLQQAATEAVSRLVAALSDDEAAALMTDACRQRPALRDALLKQLVSLQQSSPPASERPVQPAVEPRKRVKHSASSSSAASVLPKPGAHGGDYMELEVRLLSGRHVATVGTYGNDRVGVLKAEIAYQEGTPVWQQQLLLGDWELEDQETLKSYCFEEDKGRFRVTLAKRATFIPASAFQESRPGYEFKDGEHGLGYYAEEMPVNVAA